MVMNPSGKNIYESIRGNSLTFLSKKSPIVLFAILCMPKIASASPDFDHYAWNFGEIREAEGTVSHVFTLKNDGSGPLYVGRAIPSCSCITAVLPQEAILPGKTGELIVSFSPSGAVGDTFRSLEITDSEGRLLGTLSIEADVIPIDRSIQERYFYTLGDMLYANLSTVPFGYIFPGDTLTKTVFLANASPEAISIETSLPPHLSPHEAPSQPPFPIVQVGAPTSIAPGEELPLTLTYALPAESQWIGTLNDTLRLSINGKPALLPITTSAIVLQRLTDSPTPPALRTYPSSGKLTSKRNPGTAATEESDSYEASIEVHNDGQSPLQILKVETPDGLTAIVDQETIAPGEQTLLRVSCKQARKFRIRLFTNDPKRRYRDIDITYLK